MRNLKFKGNLRFKHHIDRTSTRENKKQNLRTFAQASFPLFHSVSYSKCFYSVFTLQGDITFIEQLL